MTVICFLDIETTSLDPEHGEIWEVGMVRRIADDDGKPLSAVEHHWFLDTQLEYADPMALAVGGYHQRHPHGNGVLPGVAAELPMSFAVDFAGLTNDAILVGNVISFDAERTYRLLRSWNVMPSWYYHIVDVEALAVGYLKGIGRGAGFNKFPWDSETISDRLGVELPSGLERHTALGDTRWAMRLYDAVMRSDSWE